MNTVVPLLLALGAAVVGGVFFALSNFVMTALAQLPDEQGIAAMQRINTTVLNAGFLGLFVGTALLAAIVVVGAFLAWGTPRSALLLGAGLCYLVGAFGVTAVFNVPRNERLARLVPASAEAARAWPVYVREWQRWNHVRTVASMIASAAAAAALAS